MIPTCSSAPSADVISRLQPRPKYSECNVFGVVLFLLHVYLYCFSSWRSVTECRRQFRYLVTDQTFNKSSQNLFLGFFVGFYLNHFMRQRGSNSSTCLGSVWGFSGCWFESRSNLCSFEVGCPKEKVKIAKKQSSFSGLTAQCVRGVIRRFTDGSILKRVESLCFEFNCPKEKMKSTKKQKKVPQVWKLSVLEDCSEALKT